MRLCTGVALKTRESCKMGVGPLGHVHGVFCNKSLGSLSRRMLVMLMSTVSGFPHPLPCYSQSEAV
jgi:hypothetical protein